MPVTHADVLLCHFSHFSLFLNQLISMQSWENVFVQSFKVLTLNWQKKRGQGKKRGENRKGKRVIGKRVKIGLHKYEI